MINWRFSTNISLNFEYDTIEACRPSVHGTLLPCSDGPDTRRQSRVFHTPHAFDAAANFNSFELAR